MKKIILITSLTFAIGFTVWFFFYPVVKREVQVMCIQAPCPPIVETLTPYKLFLSK